MTTEQKPQNDPYSEGFRCGEMGGEISENPYVTPSSRYLDYLFWQRGWCMGKKNHRWWQFWK